MQTVKNHIITSAIEHPAILDTCSRLESLGFRITYIPVDSRGCIDPDDVFRVLGEKTFLVSIMHANNEISTMAPLDEIGAVVRDKGICMHTDALQTVGKLPVNVDELHVDMLSMSGHKFYGPKGIGALYIRKGTTIAPLSYGGHQERNLRAGTENVPGIVALGRACQIATRDLDFQTLHLKQLRDGLESLIVDGIPDVHINGHPFRRAPHIFSVSFPRRRGRFRCQGDEQEGCFPVRRRRLHIGFCTYFSCTEGHGHASRIGRRNRKVQSRKNQPGR